MANNNIILLNEIRKAPYCPIKMAYQIFKYEKAMTNPCLLFCGHSKPCCKPWTLIENCKISKKLTTISPLQISNKLSDLVQV